MDIIKGGFALSMADERLLNQQRSLTAQINNNFIQVGATFLNMSSKSPYQPDWFNRKFRDTDLQDWIDNPDLRALNVGFNLQMGWCDIDIDSGDPVYNSSIIDALKFTQVDTRFAFGRSSKKVPSHVLVQLPEADMMNYDAAKEFEPKEFKLGGVRYKTELRSMGPIDSHSVKQARQVVMPGSIYSHKEDPGKYDISVWYDGSGNVANKIHDIAETTPRKIPFSILLTGIAFGTFLYIMRPHWTEGNRQNVAIKVAGWLARLLVESRGMNESEGISPNVFCPVNRAETAEMMIDFLCTVMGDPETNMRKRVFRDALQKLENNPDAHIPGWPALEGMIGTEALMALRTVFLPGIDVSPLTKMADNYIYIDTEDQYIDREMFSFRAEKYLYDSPTLERRHRNDFMEVGSKSKPLFKVFESSLLRKRIKTSDLYPDLPAGTIFRLSRDNELLTDDDNTQGKTVFNTWSGWPILPAENPNPELLSQCAAMLDKLFNYLTQDNKTQAEWLKHWIAWTVQFPGQKQQIAPVIVGGQGVGKSFFGNIFLKQLFRDLWGSASPRILEGNFSIEPFINKMFVFIDEAKFYNESSTDEIKKIIRNDQIGGVEKFKTARTYNVFARVLFASNRFDMNIGQQNMQDRALFYMKAYDKDYLKMSDSEFRRWAVTLKPFFDEFNTFLGRLDVKRHYMRLFNDMKVNRHVVENNDTSSSNDSHIIESNMAYARRVAKRMIEEGRVWEDLDISAPFPMSEFERRVHDLTQTMGIKTSGARVFAEFKDADLLETVMMNRNNFWRFKHRIGSLTQVFGEIIGVKLDTRFDFNDEDYGTNDSTLEGAKQWKGRNSRFRNGI